MKTRLLLIAAFCLLSPTVALLAQSETRSFTDEEDARVATVAARQNAVTESLTAGDRFHNAGDNEKAASEWNRAGRFQLKLNKPEDAIVTFQRAVDVLATNPDSKTRVDSLNGLGTGSLRESYDAVVASGAQIYASGMSSKARGVAEADLEGKPVEFAMPNKLVQLAVEHDRLFTY